MTTPALRPSGHAGPRAGRDELGFVPALLEGTATDVRYVELKGAGHYLSQNAPRN
ncbi:hypothetical protein ACF1BE_26260 [Streptomyces sp. NPDC014991]|uniref:hypothetical protein n=1 Tax=Streptomyces sp. NPDC014991 TaxID=3364935 RepID=UPI0036FDE192